jgi:amidase
MSELVLKSATALLALLRSRAVSVTELAEEHIRQIERLNPSINAFADFDPGRVRAQARELDAQPDKSAPLFGLPVTIKSSISTAGYRCEIGSLINKGSVPAEDAPAVARLRAAGALILGTTNCPEFLMAYETDNLLHGRTCNPWDLTRTPGGSSGGESAAIAAGMSAAGLGSDSGGSVRLPAHFTGICALKPTPGRIPGRGHLPPCVGPFSTLGAIGPMARTIEDVTLLFALISGQDLIDPASAPVSYRPRTLEELRGKTIGYFEDDGLVPVTPETRTAIQTSAQVLREAGFRVEPFRPRLLEPLRQLWLKFFVQCGAMFYQPAIHGKQELLSPIFREFLGIADSRGALTATELLNAWAELDLLRSKMLEEMLEKTSDAMGGHPILLCPVAGTPAFRHGEREWQIEPGAGKDSRNRSVEYLDSMRFTQWFNVLGAPAAVVPAGSSSEGLPIGVQIAGLPHEDEFVLGIAAVLDQAFGYRPPAMARIAG